MKRRIIAALVLVALAAGGGYAWLSPQFAPAADAGLTLYGNVDIREVDLGFRVAGRLQAMRFEEGDAVTAGVLLAELDAQPLQEALAVAEAGVLQAQAQLDRLNSGSRPQEVQQAQARVAEAEAALENAELELARQQGLFDDGPEQPPCLGRRPRPARSKRRPSPSQPRGIGAGGGGFPAGGHRRRKGGLGAALARRDQAKTQVQDAQLLAPSPGVILTRALEPGAILKVGSPVYTLSLTETPLRSRLCQRGQLGPGGSGHGRAHSHGLHGAGLLWAGGFCFAAGGVHAQNRGDAGIAHGPGVSAAHRGRGPGPQPAPRHAGDSGGSNTSRHLEHREGMTDVYASLGWLSCARFRSASRFSVGVRLRSIG